MAMYTLPAKPAPKLYTGNTTLKNRAFISEGVHYVVTGGYTLTLPTPSRAIAGYASYFVNNSTGSLTLSGTFVGGSSCVLDSYSASMVVCLKVTASAYKYVAIGVSPAIVGLAELIADTVGGMVTSNTETGITVAYQDADNTLDFTLSDEYIQDVVGAMFTGNTETGITATYQDGDGTIDLVVASASFDYSCTALTGGAAGALDALPSASCADMQTALVTVGNAPSSVYIYLYDADSASAESSPDVIAPDDIAGGNGRWILATLDGNMYDYGAEPGAVSSSTSGSAGSAETASRSDHSHDLGTHAHTGAADGGQVTSGSLSDWQEAVEDTVGTMVATTSTHYGISASYTDGSGTLALTNSAFKYVKTALTGGGAALDGIDGDTLADGDKALVVVGNAPGTVYIYVLDADGGAGESSPDVIVPDTNPGTKNWVLVTINGSQMDYGSTANTVCQGNDGRLLGSTAVTAVTNSVNWQDWSPTIASVPAVDTSNARYQRLGNTIFFWLDYAGADGDDWTPSTVSLPVAPNGSSYIFVNAYQSVNAAAFADMRGRVDMTDDRIEFEAAAQCTNGNAWRICISGWYEVAAA